MVYFPTIRRWPWTLKSPGVCRRGDGGEDHSWNWHIAIVQCTLPGRGGEGVWNSYFSYFVLSLPALFHSGSHLFVLFLLQKIAQFGKIYFLFLPATAPLGISSPAISSPASHRLAAPISPRFLPLCSPPPYRVSCPVFEKQVPFQVAQCTSLIHDETCPLLSKKV